MWIFLNDAALSVVEDRADPKRLLVRSRVKGDIQTALPLADVFEDLEADYRYRAFVPREDLKDALARAVDGIDYANFKGSVKQRRRHLAYMDVWGAMARVYGAYGSQRRP